MTCCSELGCRRKKPVQLTRSPLTGTWYVVTDHTEKANGLLVAKAKHRLPDDQQRQLNAMLAAFHDRPEAPVASPAGPGAPDGGDAA